MFPVYVTSDKKCLNNGTIVQLQWTNDYEEADAKMFVSVNHIVNKLWLKLGTGDKKRYVAIHKTDSHFESSMLKSLTTLYAITGCDSVSGFPGIEKKAALTTL